MQLYSMYNIQLYYYLTLKDHGIAERLINHHQYKYPTKDINDTGVISKFMFG